MDDEQFNDLGVKLDVVEVRDTFLFGAEYGGA